MFNRALQVKMIKTKKVNTEATDPPDVLLEDAVTIIGYHIERGIKKIGEAVIAYVVVDTIRKVLIAKATHR